MIPDFITHYYLPDKKPFLNLSDLTQEEKKPIVNELNKRMRDGEIDRDFPDWYFKQRKEAEFKLREAFIKKGGTPKRQSPHYFTLGKSYLFEQLYKNNFKTIEIPIELIKSNLMFSLGDTLWTFSKQYNRESDKEWINKWYQGKLYDYKEIKQIINQIDFDLTSELSRDKYQIYCIETFIWCDEELDDLLKQIGCK